MVITRSHINEQISKGGKKMANGKTRTSIKSYKGLRGNPQGWKQLLPGMYDKVTGEKLTKEQRQRRLARMGWVKQKKGKSAYTPSEKQAATSIKKAEKEAAKKKAPKTTPPILKGRPKKIVVITPTIKKKPIVEKKIVVKPTPIEFGSIRMKKKSIPRYEKKRRVKRKLGGGVITQKIKKYKLGGIVIHDSTKSTKV